MSEPMTRQQRRAAARDDASRRERLGRKGERVKRILGRGTVTEAEAAEIAEGVAREAWATGAPLARMVRAQLARQG